jgi:hypothetical protein
MVLSHKFKQIKHNKNNKIEAEIGAHCIKKNEYNK